MTCNAYPACPCEGFDYTRTAPGGFRMCGKCGHTENAHTSAKEKQLDSLLARRTEH